MSDLYDEDEEFDDTCDGFPEHQYIEIETRDGITALECRSCGAESQEPSEESL